MTDKPHIAFLLLGNAVPVLAGMGGGLHAGDILVLLYAESLVGALLSSRRVVMHRRLSRLRGHFRAFEESDGTVRAAGFAFRSTIGISIFMYGIYAFFVWMLYAMYEFTPDPDLAWYTALSVVAPLVEYLLDRPGLGSKPFEWIAKRSQDTGGRLLAFGVMIPVGGVGLMFGNIAGGLVMAAAKATVESLWGTMLAALREGKRVLPGFDDPGIQKEWRRAVKAYADETSGSEDVLDERTWHRMMQEAQGNFAHAETRLRRMGQRATFASDTETKETTVEPTQPEVPSQVFHARTDRRAIVLAQDGVQLAEIEMPGSLQLWSGTLGDTEVELKVAAPWNKFTWQLCAGDRVLASGKQPRALGVLRMPSTFRVKLSTGEYYWSKGGDLTPGWQLMDPDGETVYGRTAPGAPEGFNEALELPTDLQPADALFLVWLRWQSTDMRRSSRRRD